MSKNLTFVPLDPINEEFIRLRQRGNKDAIWSEQSRFTCESDRINLPKLEPWVFNKNKRLLFNNLTTINLTRLESLVLDLLTNSAKRIISNEEILMKLNKDPDKYKGIPMCLSRLQKKFKKCSRGDRLLRSVRNRGYCLVQIVNSE